MSYKDIDQADSKFRKSSSSLSVGKELKSNQWSDEKWRELFRYTTARKVSAGDALIQKGELDRTLYFVLSGSLEVIGHSIDGVSLGTLSKIGTGGVLGEVSFFDGNSRSASVWAVDDCEVAAMTPDQYAAFQNNHLSLALDLLFALGLILANRLRQTNAKITP